MSSWRRYSVKVNGSEVLQFNMDTAHSDSPIIYNAKVVPGLPPEAGPYGAAQYINVWLSNQGKSKWTGDDQITVIELKTYCEICRTMEMKTSAITEIKGSPMCRQHAYLLGYKKESDMSKIKKARDLIEEANQIVIYEAGNKWEEIDNIDPDDPKEELTESANELGYMIDCLRHIVTIMSHYVKDDED